MKFVKGFWLVILAPVLVGLILAIGTGAWKPWNRHHHASRTETKLFAFATDVLTRIPPGVRITSKARGTCVTSVVDPIWEAHRCFGGSTIYDPCFGGLEQTLICVNSPWTTVATRFDVQAFTFFVSLRRQVNWRPGSVRQPPKIAFKRLPYTYPWALELDNGMRCVFVDGTTFVIADERANYECSRVTGFNAGNGAWVIGFPGKSSQPWVVSYLAPKAKDTTQIDVEIAWQ